MYKSLHISTSILKTYFIWNYKTQNLPLNVAIYKVTSCHSIKNYLKHGKFGHFIVFLIIFGGIFVTKFPNFYSLWIYLEFLLLCLFTLVLWSFSTKYGKKKKKKHKMLVTKKYILKYNIYFKFFIKNYLQI